MTAAYRLKGLGWFGSCVAVVLGFYLVSLQVAAERKKLDALNGRIDMAQRDIRALETEFDTRANLAQLEKWNGDTLALTAPVAGQFVATESALASLDPGVMPGGDAKMQTAALLVPSIPAAVAPATPAAAVTAPAKVAQAVEMASADTPRAQVIRVAATRPVAARTAVATRAVVTTPRAEAAIVRAVAVAKVRPQAVAMLDKKLLSDTTFGDLLSGARAEARKR